MSIKQKLLDCLNGVALKDLPEERLLDIFVGVWNKQVKRLRRLEEELLESRRRENEAYESLRREYHELRTNPLRAVSGEYFFLVNGHYFAVRIAGREVTAYEKVTHIHYVAEPVHRLAFENAS